MHALHHSIGRSVRLGFGALGLVSCLGLAACGESSNGSRDVASLDGHDQSSTTAKAGKKAREVSEQEREDAMLDFAKCMREHGVDMPDPSSNGNGLSVITSGTVSAEGGAGSGEPGEIQLDPKIEEASKACDPILKDVFGDAPQMSPEDEAKLRDQQLAYAKCMREHGIDMPDPKVSVDGNSVQISVGSPDGGALSVDPAGSEFTEANKACQSELGDAMVGIGGVSSSGDAGTAVAP